MPIVELNSDFVDGQAWLSPSETIIYFDSDRSGEAHIYRATRSSPTAPWDPPRLSPS